MFDFLKKRRQKKLEEAIEKERKKIKERRRKQKKRKFEEIMNYLDGLSDGLISKIAPEKTEYRYFPIIKDIIRDNLFVDGDNLVCEGEDFHITYKSKKEKDEIMFGLTADYNSKFGEISLFYITDPQCGYIDKESFESLVPNKNKIDQTLERIEEMSEGEFSKSFGDSTPGPLIKKSSHLNGTVGTEIIYKPGEKSFKYSRIEVPGEEPEEEITKSLF